MCSNAPAKPGPTPEYGLRVNPRYLIYRARELVRAVVLWWTDVDKAGEVARLSGGRRRSNLNPRQISDAHGIVVWGPWCLPKAA